ncbi:cysteine-rich receptor-like protein kinase 2 isoform X2 [Pyrus x bretschneideri]|uniref:cysteine-rich receptor-like protein kinase 2 isoform X2 n=1 Tax=Pyrus x bretschneideri TaxID=225117 RepID=UPI002030A39F|nr:cysteine-rich receptor-like protein kinase 2 isoform X2 [Pyrus x bretschneideri]
MKKCNASVLSQHLLLLKILLLLGMTVGDPRTKTVQVMCGNQLEHNTTVFVPNVASTMQNISEQMRTSGFGVAVTGSGPNTDYGLAQCYGDLSLPDCVLCYDKARTVLPQCFPYTAGRIFLDGCFMRSENYSFYEEFRGSEDRVECGNTMRKSSAFGDSARQVVKRAVESAPSNRGYARGGVSVSGTENESAYVLADCWRTLDESSCRQCLENASASMLGCLPWSEGRALYTGCFMRYSDTDFLNKEMGNGSSRGTTIVIVVSVASSLVILVVGVAIGFYIWKHRYMQKKRRAASEKKQFGALFATVNKSQLNFSYEVLEKATNYFHDTNKLGQGGSGSVYKGVLPDGNVIAIKRLFFNTRQWVDHFFNEVNLISGIHHKNLLKLLGCSITGPESLLVYEYVPNQSLHDYFIVKNNVEPLRWDLRYKIILGTAEGLAYLHEESKLRIIHRDIKLSNILLDKEFNAKIADFGLARMFPEDKTHISTAIAGTLGYMAPEYAVLGKLTEKADVYSFGVLVIEIICGRRNNSVFSNSTSILQMTWDLYGTCRLREAVDPLLGGKFENEEASRLLQIGLLCVQASAELRPAMSLVVKMLTENLEIPQPTQPPFLNSGSAIFNRRIPSGSLNSLPAEFNTQSSKNSMTQSWIEPR